MSQPPPFFLSFPQFLSAPREGKLLDELRRLPRRPLTADEVSATAKVDEASAALFRANIGYMTDRPGDAYSLTGKKKQLWQRYQQAQQDWIGLQRTMRESQQRWIYDRAVEAGVIIPPQVVPDPRGELDKMEKKDERARQRELEKEADKLLPESLAPSTEVEDAALDYVENGVGRFYFRQHWAKHRDPERLAAWLQEHGYELAPEDVLAELDQLAEAGLWRS